MSVKIELLKAAIADYVVMNMQDLEFVSNKMADNNAVFLLDEIQRIIKDKNNNDFDIVEKIVTLLKMHHVDCGDCHQLD